MSKWQSMYPTSAWLGFGAWPRSTYTADGDRDPEPPLECQACSLHRTEDCTKDNCERVMTGDDPVRLPEDDPRE